MSEPQLAWIHHPVRIQGILDAPQQVQAGTVLRGHVRRELQAHAVVVVDDRAGAERRRNTVLPDAIVQLDRIAELHPASHGDVDLLLRGGTRLVLSRTWRERVQRLFQPQSME